MFKNKANLLFLILGGFFVTNALVAEFVGVKIFSLEQSLGFQPANLNFFGISRLSFSLTAGVILWPVVFVMTDVINEYYGKKGVRFLTNLAVMLIIYSFFMVWLAINLSPDTWWDSTSGLREIESESLGSMDLAFRRIFGQGLWIIVGSLVAFLVGQILDVFIFHRIKKWTGDRKVWLRATGSTVVSQLIDSYVVLFIAFYLGADWSMERVAAIANVNYIYKFSMAILMTPVIYLAHFVIDWYLGRDLSEKMKKEAAL